MEAVGWLGEIREVKAVGRLGEIREVKAVGRWGEREVNDEGSW